MSTSRHLWARDLCALLGVPGTSWNARSLVAQAQAEGGKAAFNPLNTTLAFGASTAYNRIAPGIAVQDYASYEDGLQATARTLRQPNFAVLLAALRDGTSALAYWNALGASPWGTKPPGGLTPSQWIADVDQHWFAYALAPINGT